MSRFPIFDSVRIVPRDDQFLDRRTGSAGEIYFDDTTNSLRLFDGYTAGGFELTLNDLSNVSNDSFLAKAIAAGVGSGGGGTGNTTVTVSDTLPEEPTAGNLWFNTNSGTLFLYYDDGDSQQWVQPSSVIGTPASATDGSVFVGSLAPLSPDNGDLWLNTNNGSLYVFVNDGDSSQWIQPSVPVPDIPNGLSAVALSGSYNDLDDLPVLFSGNYNDLTNRPALATVALTGDFNDLVNAPEGGGSIGNLTVISSTITTTDAGINFGSAVSFLQPVSGIRLDELSDVDVTTIEPAIGNVLKYDGLNWVPGIDGGGGGGGGDGGDADTLNGSPGSYYLDYANFTGNILNTQDSSSFTFVPAVTFNSDVTVENDLFVTNNIEAPTAVFNLVDITNITATNLSVQNGIINNVALLSTAEIITAFENSTGTVNHDCSLTSVFYHTNISNNFVVNFTNIPLRSEENYTKSFSIILNQGSIARTVSGIQLEGVNTTIKWVNNLTPTGTPAAIDIITFTIIYNPVTPIVIGSLTSFG